MLNSFGITVFLAVAEFKLQFMITKGVDGQMPPLKVLSFGFQTLHPPYRETVDGTCIILDRNVLKSPGNCCS